MTFQNISNATTSLVFNATNFFTTTNNQIDSTWWTGENITWVTLGTMGTFACCIECICVCCCNKQKETTIRLASFIRAISLKDDTRLKFIFYLTNDNGTKQFLDLKTIDNLDEYDISNLTLLQEDTEDTTAIATRLLRGNRHIIYGTDILKNRVISNVEYTYGIEEDKKVYTIKINLREISGELELVVSN